LRRLATTAWQTAGQTQHPSNRWQENLLKVGYYATEPTALLRYQTARLLQKTRAEFGTLAHAIAKHHLIADGRGVHIGLRSSDVVNNLWGIGSALLDGN